MHRARQVGPGRVQALFPKDREGCRARRCLQYTPAVRHGEFKRGLIACSPPPPVRRPADVHPHPPPPPRRPGDGFISRAPTCPRSPRAPAPSSPASTASPPPRSSKSSHCWERPQQGSSERLHRLLPRRRRRRPPPPLPPAPAAPPRQHPPQRRRRRRRQRNSQPESTSRGLTTRKEIARSNTQRPRNPAPAWR